MTELQIFECITGILTPQYLKYEGSDVSVGLLIACYAAIFT